jgi:hypothetical protein
MRLLLGLVAAATLVGSARAQTDAALAVQQKMETWTFWIMVTGAASAIFAMLGVAGLFWTFREQRKMTQSQERAVIEYGVITAEYLEGTNAVDWSIEVTNTGRTHAEGVAAELRIFDEVTWLGIILDEDDQLSGQRQRQRKLLKAKPSATAISDRVVGVAPGQTTTISFRFDEVPSDVVEELLSESGSPFVGSIHYRDIYRKTHATDVETHVVGKTREVVFSK